jgi:hypothetical protein
MAILTLILVLALLLVLIVAVVAAVAATWWAIQRQRDADDEYGPP